MAKTKTNTKADYSTRIHKGVIDINRRLNCKGCLGMKCDTYKFTELKKAKDKLIDELSRPIRRLLDKLVMKGWLRE